MSLIRQILLSLVVMAAAVAAWIAFVPSAVPVLERVGVFDLLGMEPPAPPEEESGGSWGQGAGARRFGSLFRAQNGVKAFGSNVSGAPRRVALLRRRALRPSK